MKTLMKTSLTLGKEKKVFYTEATTHHFVTMYDNPKFEKEYENVEDFITDFRPTVSSDNLINRIKKEFVKENGRITYKPSGFKANQIFHFKNVG